MTLPRFKPVRAGILGLWDYAQQVFHFADGRLVLRGPNGSGKTKALEVLVPFVLDGSIDARRLDPFSGHERTMHANLLYGGEKHGTGYCWLEFARGDEHVTLGVGMRANAAQSKVDTWFFVLDGVLDRDLSLLKPDRTPRSRRELRDALDGVGGQLYEQREAYRNAIDRRLFGLGAERYSAMLELLLTLRRPQLAKDLDPDKLSAVLAEGLRTVDRDLLSTSAEAFNALEETQRDLSALEAAARATDELLKLARTYLRARAKRRSEEVDRHAGRLRQTLHQIDEAGLHVSRSAADATRARERVDEARAEEQRAEAQLEALRSANAYQNRDQLDVLRHAVSSAQQVEQRSAQARAAADEELSRAQRQAEQAVAAHARAQEALAAAEASLASACAHAGVPTSAPLDEAELSARLIARRASIEAVLEQLKLVKDAERDLRGADQQLQGAIAASERAASDLQRARDALTAALDDAAQRLHAWHAGLPPVLAHALPLAPLLAELPKLSDGANLPHQAERAWSELRDRTVAERAELQRRERELRQAIAQKQQMIADIREEREDAPAAPTTRLASREGRAGAPLWRLVHFDDALSADERAGVEGALLAAGLLDAWVSPSDGELCSNDSALAPSTPVTGPSLADVLRPEADADVPAARIQAVLRSVALEDALVAVTPDGRFRLGPLAGHHRPDRARYIGATAREQHRAERIAALVAEVERAERDAEQLVAEVTRCAELLASLQQALATLPASDLARRAHEDVIAADARCQQAAQAKAAAADHRATRQRARDEAKRQLQRCARDHGVPDDASAVRQLQVHMAEAERALESWRRAQEELVRSASAQEQAAERAARAGAASERAAQDHAAAADEHRTSATRYEQLSASLGVEVQQIEAKMRVANDAIQVAKRANRSAATALRDADNAKIRHEAEQNVLRGKLPEQQEDLERAEASLRPFQALAVQALLAVRDGDSPFGERLAAAVAGASCTDEQLKTTETQLNNRLADLDVALGDRFHSVRSSDDGVTIVRLADETGEHELPAFHARLNERLDIARHLLNEHEQRLFERQLLTNLCMQLRERIAETRKLVHVMNEAMRERTLASKKSLGVDWRPLADAAPTRAELLGLLAIEPAFLGDERLNRLRELLSDEVRAARSDRPDRSYLEILQGAVDYRAWHSFALTLYDSDGAGRKLTKKEHSKLSGGEKAATLHLPLFAAAHAHFQAANADCPRLIALDEAFAGIDHTGVPQLLRLAADFDLDWFFTGYDLWVTEAFLPGVMHYDLAHDPGSRAVVAWPILWNGRETVEGEAARP